MHVMQTPRVWTFPTNLVGEYFSNLKGVHSLPRIFRKLGFVIAETEPSRFPRATRVLPLGFARQPILNSFFLTQYFAECLCIVPTHECRRIVVAFLH
jgi:hypothetical protein